MAVRNLRLAKSIEQKAARVLSFASLLKNPVQALTRLFKCLKVFFERLADPLKQSPVFFPFLSRELAVRSVEVRQKFLLRKFHSFFRPLQVFQRFWGWHVAPFGHYVCVTHSTISGNVAAYGPGNGDAGDPSNRLRSCGIALLGASASLDFTTLV
jgi:hypothetical protein